LGQKQDSIRIGHASQAQVHSSGIAKVPLSPDHLGHGIGLVYLCGSLAAGAVVNDHQLVWASLAV